jgi:hypothetical protein
MGGAMLAAPRRAVDRRESKGARCLGLVTHPLLTKP